MYTKVDIQLYTGAIGQFAIYILLTGSIIF